jgi:hypothetical protein
MLKALFKRLARTPGRDAPAAPAGRPSPGDPGRECIARMFAALGAGAEAEALALVEQAIALEPGNAMRHVHRGRVLLMLREYAAAEHAFDHAGALDPALDVGPYLPIVRAARDAAAPGPPPAPFEPTQPVPALVSVVACSIDAAKFARMSASYAERLAGVPHEIVGIHDARSLCEGYNRGLARARGDVVIFSHDDIEIVSPDFAARLADALAQADLVGVAGTSRLVGASWWAAGLAFKHGQVAHPRAGRWLATVFDAGPRLAPGMQALDGVFLAARRDALDGLAFDQDAFDGWHLYDVDFTFGAHRAGRRLAVCRDLLLRHHSSGSYDAAWEEYAALFIAKRGSELAPAPPRNPLLELKVPIASDAEWLRLAARLVV